MHSGRAVATAAALMTATALLAGCSSSGSTTGSAASSGPVKLDFWGWAPGYDQSVALWNKSHPDIQITFDKTASGSKGGYTKMLTAVQAGNAPCLAQVGYETLPSFAAAGALQDVTDATASAKSQFADWTWNQVTIGGKTYGAPVDTAPMALMYRKDLFAKYGITTPPATWDQYAADAAKVHAADPSVYLGDFGNDAYNYAGLAWQAGAPWFGTANQQWQVSINSAGNAKVASYWQGLLDKKLLKTDPSYDPSLYADMASGKILSDVNAVWDAPIIASSVKGTSGQWAVAPMPVWDASNPVYGNDGGSATAVLKGCAHAKEAAEFALWMSTDPDSVANLIKVTGIYPAATSGLSNPALSAPDPFYGGQKIYDVFNAEMPHINTSWQWGPTMTQTSTDLGDGLGQAGTGGATLPSVLGTVQSKTVAQMKQQGLTVTG
ncbi:extracellular solute-binding protein [Streptacidiphilus jiangxiensis]|uniref:Multiple sugar transport system substrate-binding protein n=1 Tax=Streptacidiphilus jiangxiensis TaxID=235985 RepID=A0A1H7V875_STRJI|nr:extracellular solute-binding protein [Streptacidiphilus jiangxiensis]SEM05240.1 multiple sugar transport system substrate-binding protein [Streptacidiphilus jiangxiensis]